MNIVEAMRSGKRYRQIGDWGYYNPPAESKNYGFSVEQILADNWEVEGTPVTVTREYLLRAYFEALKSDDVKDGRTGLIHEMIRMLGL